MSRYVRPVVPAQTYRDANGAVIDYGNQWGGQSPPEETYSRDSHPERFAPLHRIADALIDYLRRNYDAEVADDLTCARDLMHPVDAVRAVRLSPASADAAPLTFVFTDYPSLVVHAGLLHDFVYPQCGCDACDETCDSVADELEWNVEAVVSGGFREEIRGDVAEPWIWHQLTADDGSHRSSGGGGAIASARARVDAAAARLQALPAGWAAWPRRTGA